MHDPIIIGASVQLARNYPDLPFDLSARDEASTLVIARTSAALEDAGYALRLLREMSEDNRQALAESGLITRQLLAAEKTAAVLLPEKGAATVMLGGENHVTIVSQGKSLAEVAAACFGADDRLSRRVRFAFDEELGYLASQPSRIGTGMRAALRLHLPMLVSEKQLPEARKVAEEAGTLLYGLYPASGKPAGDVMEISNAMAQGRTEAEICDLVVSVAKRLCEMEKELRMKAFKENPARMKDRVCRALGIMKSAHLLGADEFWRLWSDVRLGAEMELLPVRAAQVDALLPEALPAHLRNWVQEPLSGEKLDGCRAIRVRELLAGVPLK